MSWNFRLVRDEEVVTLREVYYDDHGCPEMVSTGEVKIFTSIGEDVSWYQKHMAEGILKPVLEYPFTGPQQLELEF